MNVSKFFSEYSTVGGLNADLERHRVTRERFKNNIMEMEARILKNPNDTSAKIVLQTYKSLLEKLEDSYGDVASKIGGK